MQSDSERTHRKFIRILFPNTQHWEEIGNQGLMLASFKSSSVSSLPGSGSLKAFHTQDTEKPQRQKEIVSKQTNKKVSCQLSPTASSGKPRLFFISNPSSTFLCLQNFTQSSVQLVYLSLRSSPKALLCNLFSEGMKSINHIK